MTDEQREQYLASHGLRCPWCRSEMIEGDSVEVDSGHASQEVHCVDCGREWRDIYKLVDVEASEENEEEPTPIVLEAPIKAD
jgi:hypothetical protein